MLLCGDERHMMKLVFSTTSVAELEALQQILSNEGVPSELRSTGAADALSGTPFAAELWVTHDRDYPHARALYENWFRPGAAASRVASV